MKRLTDKIRTILADSNGESLIESMVSIMVFALFLLAVATMLNISLRIIANSNAAAVQSQTEANNAILENVVGTEEKEFTLKGVITDEADVVIDVTFDVNLANDGSFVAFAPERS